MSLSFESSNTGEKVLEMSRAGRAPGHPGTQASGTGRNRSHHPREVQDNRVRLHCSIPGTRQALRITLTSVHNVLTTQLRSLWIRSKRALVTFRSSAPLHSEAPDSTGGVFSVFFLRPIQGSFWKGTGGMGCATSHLHDLGVACSPFACISRPV